MLIITKIIILITLIVITYEDVSSRMVHTIVFPILGFLLGYHHLQYSSTILFFANVGMNITLVSSVLLTLFIYCKLFLKKAFLNTSFGLGDLLFFYAISVAFPTTTFTILFVFSLIFSLALHFIRKQRKVEITIPLAGYMALFFTIILGINSISNQPNLYQF